MRRETGLVPRERAAIWSESGIKASPPIMFGVKKPYHGVKSPEYGAKPKRFCEKQNCCLEWSGVMSSIELLFIT
ncbi:hypothetical protein [Bacillus marinisedimentorum]|uniref:hypothetical protein n=1 Tax=Bacillus marinisedimentorum TaxID=1821260 RepID=UPI000871B836|nr:hypothetical protein [Bacillus marinisedimentorum]